MSSRRVLAAGLSGLALTISGMLMTLAWQRGLFASLLGLALTILWLVAAGCWAAARTPSARAAGATPTPVLREPPLEALFDLIPLPLIRLEDGAARAMNRAGRSLFATDDQIRPMPDALRRPHQTRLRQAGRSWRIARVETGGGRALAMLIDVEAERRAAEAHADNEMIDILGHELLNGLSPIVSLADSAQVAAERGDPRLHGILATLARRTEGLERFTRAYRMLARLPDPVRAEMPVAELAEDLARLFGERFGGRVALTIDIPPALTAAIDRDQMTQGLWALLQNAAEAALTGSAPPCVGLHVAPGDKTLCITVTDSGPGVPAPERSRIFRPFHTTKPDGSGIGLTLARRIARGHGGDLTLLPVAATSFAMTVALS